MAFQYRDRERLGPPPPEIQVYGASAFADGQGFTFDDREKALFGQQPWPIPSLNYHIIRIAPQTKFGDPGHTFL